MKALLIKLGAFNSWYDALKEPKRFLLFMFAMSLAVIPLQLGMSTGSAFAVIFGFVIFAIMITIAFSRAFSFSGTYKYVGVILAAALWLTGSIVLMNVSFLIGKHV